MANSLTIPIPNLDDDLNAALQTATNSFVANDPQLQDLKHFLITAQALRNNASLLQTLTDLEKKMSAQLDALAGQVSQNTTVIESAIALINGFNTRLSEGISAAQAGDLSKLQMLQSELATEDQKLAAAVAANTPAAPSATGTATATAATAEAPAATAPAAEAPK